VPDQEKRSGTTTAKRGAQMLFNEGSQNEGPDGNPFKNLTTVNVVQNVVNYNINGSIQNKKAQDLNSSFQRASSMSRSFMMS
jgi:hypothetical protein